MALWGVRDLGVRLTKPNRRLNFCHEFSSSSKPKMRQKYEWRPFRPPNGRAESTRCSSAQWQLLASSKTRPMQRVLRQIGCKNRADSSRTLEPKLPPSLTQAPLLWQVKAPRNPFGACPWVVLRQGSGGGGNMSEWIVAPKLARNHPATIQLCIFATFSDAASVS